ncbi:3-oxoacyl-ACP synthase [Wenyingzhuangia sp. 2_MG-2023]|nr:3-oxoacyl-ACP synthase [Wenyingzhuangia sp. 2_MG-2023]MDO6736548.1 3-oxoacyl-ACP synthase [Wenyingzhuangia sp. 2_MG-2023]MDO6801157.1 3-oxoacyl-ACP synthase [Wenyingzhuangia sp. 1_MG-2023]
MKVSKQEILQECIRLIDGKLQQIQNAIQDYQEDLNSETKSSAGDKHETGRAMLQLEMEKLGQQYQTVLTQKNVLQKIDVSVKKKAQVGSLVGTTSGLNYFLATSVGQIVVAEKSIMVVSINSPIGKLILGKQKGAIFVFNSKENEISFVM